MELNRRNFLLTSAAALPMAATVACSATGVLQKINAITSAADAVLTTLDSALCPTPTTCVALPYVPLVDAWIASIQGANTKALAIANGAATLTPTQITEIIGLYAGALAFNIPGIPAAVTVVINAAVAAIKVLFSFLGASAPAIAAMANGDQQAIAHTAAVLAGELKTNRGLFFKEHVRSSIKLNNALGTHLTTQTAKLSSAKAELGSRVVTSAGGFGTGGFGQ